MPFPRPPLLAVPHFVAVRDFALFGIWRRSGFRAVRDFALSGIQRRYGPAPFALFAAA